MNRYQFAALAGIVVFAVPAGAQQRSIDLEIKHHCDSSFPVVSVPLSLSKNDAAKRELMIDIVAGPRFGRPMLGQLTAPGLRTEHIKPAGKDLVRRDCHISLFGDFKAGDVTKLKLLLDKRGLIAGAGYHWQFKQDEYADLSLNYGKRPVLRYMHQAYDNSAKQKRDQTYRVFHHLYGFRAGFGGFKGFKGGKGAKGGKGFKGFGGGNPRFITNGGWTNDPLPKNPKDNLYPHHRGLMYGFSKITYDGNKKCNTWSCTPGDTHQAHAKFLATETGRVMARQRAAIDWHGPDNKVFAKEEREITAFSSKNYLRTTLIEFTSRLKTTGGLVKLRGDPQHAGFQFRAHNDLHEQKSEKQTYFLRPDGKGNFGETRNWDPKTKKGPINLPWDACSFVLDGNRYTVAYLNHPSNPGESRWSERSYGRFGCYFEYDLTEKNPLVVTYRIWLQGGEMTVEQAEALSRAFREPPKVTVK